MTNIEFSTEFDVILNNSTIGTLPLRLDEYEKSVFLTKAQENLVLSTYTGQNATGDHFEDTELARAILRPLIETDTLVAVAIGDVNKQLWDDKYTHSYWRLPTNNLWFILYEQVSQLDDCLNPCYNGKSATVSVVGIDQYNNLLNNPFKGPSEKRVFRVDYGAPLTSQDNAVLELISKYNVDSYRMRYLRRPLPIILQNLPTGLSINNTTTYTECELGSSTHRRILEDAVRLALASKSMGFQPNQEK